jgi:hypothetical protein
MPLTHRWETSYTGSVECEDGSWRSGVGGRGSTVRQMCVSRGACASFFQPVGSSRRSELYCHVASGEFRDGAIRFVVARIVQATCILSQAIDAFRGSFTTSAQYLHESTKCCRFCTTDSGRVVAFEFGHVSVVNRDDCDGDAQKHRETTADRSLRVACCSRALSTLSIGVEGHRRSIHVRRRTQRLAGE